jgi:hypothetical protein
MHDRLYTDFFVLFEVGIKLQELNFLSRNINTNSVHGTKSLHFVSNDFFNEKVRLMRKRELTANALSSSFQSLLDRYLTLNSNTSIVREFPVPQDESAVLVARMVEMGGNIVKDVPW